MREFGCQHPHWRLSPIRLQPHLDDEDGDDEPFDLNLFSGGPTQKEIEVARTAMQTALNSGSTTA